MEWYLWVLIVLGGGFIAFQVFKTFLGASVPIGTAGRLYLSDHLKKMGIRHLVPDQCIAEIADRSSSVAEMMAKMGGKGQMSAKTEMVSSLDVQAQMIWIWYQGSDDLVKKDKPLVETMGKYGILYGCLGKKSA
jgi:hypothetical protein